MRSGTPSVAGLVRVTVMSARRRVDLALPSAVEVAHLLPGLARALGVLEVAGASRGHVIVTERGTVLRPDCGLAAQDIEDGQVLVVVPAGDAPPPPRYDDPVEAMTDVVEASVRAERDYWPHALVERSDLIAATVLLVVGIGGLAGPHGSASASSAAAVVACLLLAGAAWASRVRARPGPGLLLAYLGTGSAAVAGLDLGGTAAGDGHAVVLAGGGALVAGTVSTVASDADRLLMLPALAVGASCLAVGLLVVLTDRVADVVLPVTLLLVLLVGGVLPGAALSAAGAGRHVSGSDSVVDLPALAADTVRAGRILLAVNATAGVLLVLLAPAVTATGPAGPTLPALASCVVLLRTRRLRRALDVVIGLVTGVATLVFTVVTLWYLDDARGLPAAVAVALAGAWLVGRELRQSPRGYRGAWVADLLETAALVALLPCLMATLATRTQ